MLLLCGQAQAADYVRCEAMQAANGRLVAQQKQAGNAAYDNKLDEQCPYTLNKTGLERLQCANQDSSNQAAHAAREMAEADYTARLTKVKADYAKEGCL